MLKHHNVRHIHKLLKVEPVWKCVLHDCTYFLHNKQAYALPGRVICWNCDRPFPFDDNARKMVVPLCLECQQIDLEDVLANVANK